MLQNLKEFGCAMFSSMRAAIEETSLFTRSKIFPIGFNMQLSSIGNLVTPSNTYPNGIPDPDTQAQVIVQQGGVLVECQIKASIQNNGTGDRFFLGAMINPGGTVNVESTNGMIASLVYDKTSDDTISAIVTYSPYGGPYLDVGTIIRPVFAGDGGATLLYTINIKVADKKGHLLTQQ